MMVSNEPRLTFLMENLEINVLDYWSKWKDNLCSRFCSILGIVTFLKIYDRGGFFWEVIRKANIIFMENLNNIYNSWWKSRYARKFSENTFITQSKSCNFGGIYCTFMPFRRFSFCYDHKSQFSLNCEASFHCHNEDQPGIALTPWRHENWCNNTVF